MRMKMVGVLVVMLVGNSFATVSLAQEPGDLRLQALQERSSVQGGRAEQVTSVAGDASFAKRGQVSADAIAHANASGLASTPVNTVGNVTVSADVTPLLTKIATWREFADWQQGQARQVRTLYDPSGHAIAVLWQVVNVHSQPIGYLVSTLDGKQAYEFSHRELPTAPTSLEPKIMDNGYLYAGPMLHLVYVHGLDGLELYNLVTGETLPSGELLNNVPQLPPVPQVSQPDAQTEQQPATEQAIEQALPRSTAPEDDAFFATGLFGQYKLKQQKGILPLTDALKGDAQVLKSGRSFVVYDAIPDKLTVPLAMTKLVQQGTTTYVGLQDPFAETDARKLPVYIDSRFPVFVAPLGAPAKTPSAT